jgi:hypothetical protein
VSGRVEAVGSFCVAPRRVADSLGYDRSAKQVLIAAPGASRKMKKLFVLLIMTVSSTAWSCDSLEGAWELVYAIYKDKDGKVVYENKGDGEKSLKILAQRHFSFITQDKDGKFSVAGAGSYTLDGLKYTEIVNYTSMNRLMGKTYHFNCQMKDGTWIPTGNEDHLFIEEHWKPAK